MVIYSVHSVEQKRLALIRIFSFLAVLVTVIVIASGLIRTIVHFMLKVRTWCYYFFLADNVYIERPDC